MKKLTSAEVLNRRYGVEVEMYHITRRNAAIVIHDALEAYTGVTYNLDYVPSEGYDKSVVYPRADGRTLTSCWSIVSDGSIRSSCGSEQTELNSPLLSWGDMDMLQSIVRALRQAGARSDSGHACGIHVHVDTFGFDAPQLRNLVNVMSAHEELLIGALNLDNARLNMWCHPVDPHFLRRVNQVKPETLAELKDVWYRTNGGVGPGQHYDPSRYHMLNLHSFFQGKGVEFRLFQFDNYNADAPVGQRGGMHAGVLKAYVQLCLAMCAYAAVATRTSPDVLHNGNQKYAMRCWLLRLGFIGPEFKTARDLYLRRLSGDCSFLHGRPTNNASVA
jgi:hypothetical protein